MVEYLDFATNLARQAGTIIRNNFGRTFTIEAKSDLSPVTQIDKQINKLVIENIKDKYPTHGLLGEEADFGSGMEQQQWLCDPLDGTKSFILGIPQSVFMLALLEDGLPQLSVVYDPFTDKLYHAVRGKGAYCNQAPIFVSKQTIKEGYVLMDNSSFGCIGTLKAMGGRMQQVSGTGYKCMMVASDKAIGFINHKADFHDIGPASLIIQEAGGKVTALDGSPLRFNNKIGGVVASNGITHKALLKAANSAD